MSIGEPRSRSVKGPRHIDLLCRVNEDNVLRVVTRGGVRIGNNRRTLFVNDVENVLIFLRRDGVVQRDYAER